MALNTFLTGGAAALVLATFIPFTLPSSLHVERAAIINSQPDKLYEMIVSSSGYQKFNPYKSADPDLKITFKGPKTGIGSGFAFDGKDGKGVQIVSSVEENKHVTMAIDLGFKGQPTQTFSLVPADNGTKVIWAMDMDFGWNPIGRVMGLFLDKQIGDVFEQGLKNMTAALAKSA